MNDGSLQTAGQELSLEKLNAATKKLCMYCANAVRILCKDSYNQLTQHAANEPAESASCTRKIR